MATPNPSLTPYAMMAAIHDGNAFFEPVPDEIASQNPVALRALYPYSRAALTPGMMVPVTSFTPDGNPLTFANLLDPEVFYTVESADFYTATLFKTFDFGLMTEADGTVVPNDLSTRDSTYPSELCIQVQPDKRIMILSQASVNRIPLTRAGQPTQDRIRILGGLKGPTPLANPQTSSSQTGSYSFSQSERTIQNTTTFFRRCYGTDSSNVEHIMGEYLGPNMNPKSEQAVANLQSRIPVNNYTKGRTIVSNKQNASHLMMGFITVDAPTYNVNTGELSSLHHKAFQTKEQLKQKRARTVVDVAFEVTSTFMHISAMVGQAWSRDAAIRQCCDGLIDQLELRDGHAGSGLEHCKVPVIDNAVAIIIAEWARFTNNKAHLVYRTAEYIQRSRSILTLDINAIIRDSSLPSSDLHQTEIQVIGQVHKPTNDKPVGGGAGREKRKTPQLPDRSVRPKQEPLPSSALDKSWRCPDCAKPNCAFDLYSQLKPSRSPCTSDPCSRCHCKIALPMSHQKKDDLLAGLSESGVKESMKTVIRSELNKH